MPRRKSVKKTVKFSDDERHLIQRAALAVWEDIAFDILTAVSEEDEQDVNDVTIPRDTVIELALDAGRMTSRLRDQMPDRSRKPNPLVTDDLLKRIDEVDYAELIALVKPAFPFSSYGL